MGACKSEHAPSESQYLFTFAHPRVGGRTGPNVTPRIVRNATRDVPIPTLVRRRPDRDDEQQHPVHRQRCDSPHATQPACAVGSVHRASARAERSDRARLGRSTTRCAQSSFGTKQTRALRALKRRHAQFLRPRSPAERRQSRRALLTLPHNELRAQQKPSPVQLHRDSACLRPPQKEMLEWSADSSVAR
jgi:hypothetical protein